jgi:HAD superfamily hydrolase (TIGR01549 family)
MEGKLLSHNNISTILFDLDGTLRHNRPSFTEIFFALAVRLDAPDSEENRRRATRWLHYYWAQSAELAADRQVFMDDEAFWINHARLFLVNLGCSPAQAEISAPKLYTYYLEEYQPEDWVPPDVPETLETLIEAGYTLGVASNRSQPYHDQLEALCLDGYFECAVAAGEVNSWKPNPEIFHHALNELDSQPDETIYVGDNYFADVVGAQRAGLQPILLDPLGIFPEASCPVIKSIGDLIDTLNQPPQTPPLTNTIS